MRKKLFYICFFFTALTQAQPTWNFGRSHWVVWQHDGMGGTAGYSRIVTDTINADTTIGSTLYTKALWMPSNLYLFAIRSDNHKVYGVPKYQTNEYLMYDFMANPGDTLHNVITGSPYALNGGLVDVYVYDTETYYMDGQYYKILSVENLSTGWETGWLENVGSIEGGLVFSSSNMGNDVLFCYSRNDTTIFNGSNFDTVVWGGGADTIYSSPGNECLYTSIAENEVPEIMIYPNPSAGLFTIENLKNEDQLSMYDLTGKRVWEKTVRDHRINVDIGDKASGLYLLRRVSRNKQVQQIKLIKE